MPIPSDIAARLKTSLERFDCEAVRAANQAGPSEVHDLRVSVRRLEQALEIFSEWLPAKPVSKIRRRLAKTLKMAGEVRDRDIALELVEHLEMKVRDDVRLAFRSDREAAAKRFQAALGTLIEAKTTTSWRSRLGFESQEDQAALPSLAVSLLPELAREFIGSGSQLAAHPKSRRRLHRFRVSAKRFRYSMEFLSDLYVRTIEKRIATVRKVQTALGDLQDCVATRGLLRDSGMSRGVLKPLRREENKRLHDFQELWPRLFDGQAAEEWARFLARKRPARRPAP